MILEEGDKGRAEELECGAVLTAISREISEHHQDRFWKTPQVSCKGRLQRIFEMAKRQLFGSKG